MNIEYFYSHTVHVENVLKHMTFYRSAIVTTALSCTIFELFEYFYSHTVHVENVLKHMTFYWSAIVTTALSCTIFELFEYFYSHTVHVENVLEHVQTELICAKCDNQLSRGCAHTNLYHSELFARIIIVTKQHLQRKCCIHNTAELCTKL